MPVPNPLKRLRVQLGLSQAQVAEKVGVSQPNYQRWESGAAKIPEGKREDLAKVLHSTVDVLTGDARYASAPMSIIAGGEGYWGEAAIHFVSGSEPVVVSISAKESRRLVSAIQGRENAFVEVIGLCNEHYLIRRSAISEVYLSDEACDTVGLGEDAYASFMAVPVVDARLWDVLSNFHQDNESLEYDLPHEDIVEALSYFMTRSEMLDYLPVLSDVATPEPSASFESVTQQVARNLGIATARAGDTAGQDQRDFMKSFLLSRAADTVVRLGRGIERRFVLREVGDYSENYANLKGLVPGQHHVAAFTVDDDQLGFYPADALDFVRFPKHYLARALDGLELNIFGSGSDDDED